MHKDIPVCMMEIDEDGTIHRVRRNEDSTEHFPLGGQMNNMRFIEWWQDRAIPKTRHGAKTALQQLGYSSTNSALVNNLALSLSDCYWIRPRDENIRWADVNLFANDFVDTFGEITINRNYIVDLRKLARFNCATSQGELQKKWCIAGDGRRYLIKGNYGDSYQQSINEVFATSLHEKQGFKEHTPYILTRVMIDGNVEGLGCVSFDFCSEEIESISAWEILRTVKTRRNESYYYPIKETCISLGMSEEYFDRFMDYQIMTDYLISNTDRHMNNIAVMRNPDTLELIGFTPIYDSGNSMFYNVPYDQLSQIRIDQIKTHSFVEREAKILRYVRNRQSINFDKLDMDFSIYEQDVKERHIRIPLLKNLFERKKDRLFAFQKGVDIWKDAQYR